MEYCPNCGKSVEEGQDYCANCGNELNSSGKEVEEDEEDTNTGNNQGTGVDNKLEESESHNKNSSSSNFFTFQKLLFFTVIAILFAVILPKLPVLMASTGIGDVPGVDPLEIESTSVSFANLEDGLVLNIDVNNPNGYTADLGRVTYDVYVDGQHVGSGEKQTYESIPSNSESSITSDINIDFSGSLGAGVGVVGNELMGETTQVRVEGKWHYTVGPASFSIPFEDKSEV